MKIKMVTGCCSEMFLGSKSLISLPHSYFSAWTYTHVYEHIHVTYVWNRQNVLTRHSCVFIYIYVYIVYAECSDLLARGWESWEDQKLEDWLAVSEQGEIMKNCITVGQVVFNYGRQFSTSTWNIFLSPAVTRPDAGKSHSPKNCNLAMSSEQDRAAASIMTYGCNRVDVDLEKGSLNLDFSSCFFCEINTRDTCPYTLYLNWMISNWKPGSIYIKIKSFIYSGMVCIPDLHAYMCVSMEAKLEWKTVLDGMQEAGRLLMQISKTLDSRNFNPWLRHANLMFYR